MICPLCDKPLYEIELAGQTVDRCDECVGTWFDEDELGKVLRLADAAEGTKPHESKRPRPLPCPHCQEPMSVVNYAHDSGVFINKCQECAGVWLREGQLEQIASYRQGTPAEKALAASMGADFRRQRRWDTLRGAIRSRRLVVLVVLIYIGLGIASGGGLQSVLSIGKALAIPAGCIWFCDSWGRLTGIALGLGRPVVTRESQGDFLAIAAWFFLLIPLVMMLISLFKQ